MHYVVRTAFHGGGVVSRHRTREAAERAAARYRRGDCTCGCAQVIPAEQYEALPEAMSALSPYAAAR